MPTFWHGKNSYFNIQDAGNTARDISTSCRSVNFPRQSDTAESSAFGTTAKTYVLGLVGATISIEGMWDATVDGYLSGLIGFATSRAFIYGPSGSTATRVKYSGSCWLTSYNVSGAIGDIVSFTADFQITGAVSVGTF